MSEKICVKCKRVLDATADFYVCAGYNRKECKSCTKIANIKYQMVNKVWRKDSIKNFNRDYYQRNKDKFKVYRERFKAKKKGDLSQDPPGG